MNDMTTLANPFRTWAELARGLRNRVVEEWSPNPQSAALSPYAAEFLGSLTALATHCDKLGEYLRRLEEHDHDAFDRFLKALERS
jgi:hypothetical protein